MHSGHGHIKHYLASSNNDYQSLSPGRQIFGSLSFLQAQHIHALPPPSKEEKPNTLSWSSLHPTVFGLEVMFDSLCRREWCQHPVKMWLPCIWRPATHKDKLSSSHTPNIPRVRQDEDRTYTLNTPTQHQEHGRQQGSLLHLNFVIPLGKMFSLYPGEGMFLIRLQFSSLGATSLFIVFMSPGSLLWESLLFL